MRAPFYHPVRRNVGGDGVFTFRKAMAKNYEMNKICVHHILFVFLAVVVCGEVVWCKDVVMLSNIESQHNKNCT